MRRSQLPARPLAVAALIAAVLAVPLHPLASAAAHPVAALAIPAAADPARLAASVLRLQRMQTAALAAADDTAAEASRLDAAQLQADQALADALSVLQQRRAANSGQLRQLYVSGGNLSMLGELVTGGRPEDLIDRARLVTAVADNHTVSSRAAAAAAREAADRAGNVAALADDQISLANEAGMRAVRLTAEVAAVSAALATAQAAARLAAQQRAARAAAADAARIRAAQAAQAAREAALGRQLSVTAAAVRTVFDSAQQAGSAGSRHVPAGTVPSAYRAAISVAGHSCPATLSPALLAAQLATESGWNPLAVSAAGAEGLGQFLPGTWAAHGIDGDGDGDAQAFDPYDAIASAAAYDCAVARIVARVPGDPVDTMLAAYNAGPGAVLASGGVPADPEVAGYIATIRGRAPGYGTVNGELR